MSKIKNNSLTLSGAGCFIAVPIYGNSGRQRVNGRQKKNSDLTIRTEHSTNQSPGNHVIGFISYWSAQKESQLSQTDRTSAGAVATLRSRSFEVIMVIVRQFTIHIRYTVTIMYRLQGVPLAFLTVHKPSRVFQLG